MTIYYVDTSAAVKLLADEMHSEAFTDFYDRADATWTASSLLRIEMTRVVKRAAPDLLPQLDEVLSAFAFLAIDEPVVQAAMVEPDPALRSLDAIHLASARMFGAELSGLVTYDDRLGAAASAAGLTVISPRDTAAD